MKFKGENMANTPVVNRGGAPNIAPTPSSSHPLLTAAHGQGQGVLSHITSGGPNKSGSGIIIGTNKPAPTPTPNVIGPNRNVVEPCGQNPLAIAASRVVNSIYGTGSLTSNQVHVNSVQSNIRDALAVAKQFNNSNLITQLTNAQTQFNNAANAKDDTTRAQALNSARAAMNSAHAELASMGYNGGKQPAGSVSTPNNGKLF